MSRCNCWCDCFLGFSPFTCFYIIGFTMSIFSLVLGIIDLVYYVYYLSGAIPGTTGSIFFLYIAVTIYVGNSIKNCCLCCTEFDDNPSKDLDAYNLLAFLAIVFALIDGFIKFSISLPTSMVFFAFAAIGTYFLVLTFQSRTEVSTLRTRISQAENGTVTVFPTSRSEAPQFQMPVRVDRVEVEGK